MRKPPTWMLVTCGVLAVGLVVAVILARGRTVEQRSLGPLIWSDEFSGDAGVAPDGLKWKNDVGGRDAELQYYTDGNANTFLDGQGHLVIEARRENPADYQCHYGVCTFTSGRLVSAGRFSHTYGRYEARIRVPEGVGAWPAFWMLGDDIAAHLWPASGEIDIMENVGREPGTVYGSAHGPGYSGAESITRAATLPDGAALADDFHTYAVDWNPDSIIWSLDGKAYGEMQRSDLDGDPWVFDKPYFLLLNLAVGGAWPGPPNADTAFPLRMEVDYVRVYDRPAASPARTDLPAGSAVSLQGYGGNCLDVESTPGAAVHMWECQELDSQRWTLGRDGTLSSLGLCLSPAGGRLDDGTTLEVGPCTGAPTQKFRYDPASRALVSEVGGKCLDVSDFSARNGARLQVRGCTGGGNQRWTAIP